MEKSKSRRSARFFCYRLLTGICLLLQSVWSAAAYDYSGMQVAPRDTYAFTDEECIFELLLPQVTPSRVVMNVQSLPAGVTLREIRKSETIAEGGRGTLVEMVFVFSKPGEYSLPAVAARIAYGGYAFRFKPVTVIENPLTLMPVAEIVPENPEVLKTGVPAGTPVRCVLSVRYFSKLFSAVPELRENMLFRTKEQLTAFPYEIAQFTPDETRTSVFEWIPFEPGVQETPPVHLVCGAWNGTRHTVTAQPFALTVLPPEKNAALQPPADTGTIAISGAAGLSAGTAPADAGYSADAGYTAAGFAEAYTYAETLASLREKERGALFPGTWRAERRALEISSGFPVSPASDDEPSLFSAAVAVAAGVCALCALVVYIIGRKKRPGAAAILVFAVSLFCMAAFGIRTAVSRAGHYAVTAGGFVRMIPEPDDSVVKYPVYPGQRVKVQTQAGDWVYIAGGQVLSGWTERTNLVFYGK